MIEGEQLAAHLHSHSSAVGGEQLNEISSLHHEAHQLLATEMTLELIRVVFRASATMSEQYWRNVGNNLVALASKFESRQQQLLPALS